MSQRTPAFRNESPPVYSSAKSRCGSSPRRTRCALCASVPSSHGTQPWLSCDATKTAPPKRPAAGTALDAAPASCPERDRTPGPAGPYGGTDDSLALVTPRSSRSTTLGPRAGGPRARSARRP